MKKITIEISLAEYKGIRDYLMSDEMQGNKAEIAAYIENILSAVLSNPQDAVFDFIAKYLPNNH
jgi:hypothetical protein